MIALSHLFEQNPSRASRAYEIGKDAASLGYDVSKDTGSHVMRHRSKYGWGAVGAGSTLAAQKGWKKLRDSFIKTKQKTE